MQTGSDGTLEERAEEAARLFETLPECVQRAVEVTLPSGPGQRHHRLFHLASRLKALPGFEEQQPRETVLRVWHALCAPVVEHKEFGLTLAAFRAAWNNCQPWSPATLVEATAEAKRPPYPACTARYQTHGVRCLVSLCHALQRRAGAGTFFLSGRTAGECIGISHVTANSYLKLLSSESVLEQIEPARRIKTSEGLKWHAPLWRFTGEV